MSRISLVRPTFFCFALMALSSCRIAGICANGTCSDSDRGVNTNEGDECRNTSFLGDWKKRSGNEVVSFDANCQFKSTECNKTGTFTRIADDAGSFDLTLNFYMGRRDESCPVPGTYRCRFEVSSGGNVFGVNCKDPETGDQALGGTFDLN